ncbi:MAG: DNA polymerase [Candidatus Pacebacteria bacterium]|jgi:DNA polymerase-1|nr:DNA polymerase [Candidatus Paceibacterota bacterium]HJO89560.1 DNA polymerase [Candidatus Paceibacterota bacterium]|tara:strand:+ start:99 stop:2480 length:2382 start_codon:yes stop_codon:yes gene_type:complete
MVKKKKKRLVLLDAHAILHRAYHALPDFTSDKGEPTGALYGLSSMLMKIIADLKPDYLAACYDLQEPTYRHEVYEDYKAGRPKTDDELIAQMDRSRDIFESFGIPIYEKVGFEADDVLGTIVEQVKDKKDIDTIIASGDMDTLQLVNNKKVCVYTLKKGIKETIVYDEEGVEERFGFKPEFLIDYKGLRGDPSDNIPGVAGIGEKTATELIQKFGTIEDIYKILKKDKKKFEKAGIKPRIVGILEENEEEAQFSKMLATIRLDVPIKFEIPKEKWEEALEIENILALFQELGFRTLSQRVRDTFGGSDNDTTEEKEVESSEEPLEVDEKELKKIAVAVWLLKSDITNPELEEILEFANTDSYDEAKETILAEIKKQKLEKVYEEIELPLIPVVEKMKEVGIKIDAKYLKNLSNDYHKKLSALEKKIYKHANGEFNVNSPKQLGEVLFDKLGLAPKNQKKTGTGARSTRESELEKMKDMHPIIKEIFSHRELQKLLSTYIDNIPQLLDKKNRLHATFLQAGTTTGRMASQNPNLQNIPIRTELGRKIRNAFVASSGYKLVALDYSQIELRVAAFLSGDEKLIENFKEGGDIHAKMASEVFDVPIDMVDAEMRREAKVINFGIQYGMGVNSLKENLGTTRAEAQKYYNEYFKIFSGLAHYLHEIKADAAREGFTKTYFGRKRHFEGINSRIPYIRAMAERMAINAPIQGTQSDIIKIAMSQVDDYLIKENIIEDAHLLLQVHDELVYEIKNDKVEEISKEIKNIMESVIEPKDIYDIELKVDVSTGDNWGEMKKL